MAFKVTITISHDCELAKLRMVLGQDFRVLCTGYFDLFIFESKLEASQMNFLLQSYNIDPKEKITASNDPQQSFLFLKCKSSSRDHLMHFYTTIFSKLGIVFAYPKITKKGEEYLYHCLDAKSNSDVLKELENNVEFTVETIHEYDADEYYGNFMFSIGDLMNELSPLQANLLVEAYQHGYYKVPREIRTLDIANKSGKSRYAVDKIIRTAEGKIMHFIYPYLK